MPDQQEEILKEVKKLLEGSGLAVLGAIPYSPALGSVRLNEVSTVFEILCSINMSGKIKMFGVSYCIFLTVGLP